MDWNEKNPHLRTDLQVGFAERVSLSLPWAEDEIGASLVSVGKRLFFAMAASIFELPCDSGLPWPLPIGSRRLFHSAVLRNGAAYRCTPPRKPLIFLPRRKISRFLLGNLSCVHPVRPVKHLSI
ncbi:hypothetical protein A7E78_09370 [Syntrophotalea acetylenivorans]|uniref:Uncharacterized protein n=1 Tax=Syntrophotalea acetylenivorans TaxID=1842532 RepID=A0A1L3GQ00_9BACT|nr:hypothetical protein A7E78_09370 [Syntrophotalea acetylenivorans]